mgnify:CR=1 FL=1
MAQGQILPWRSVSIKAQQAGRIEALLKQQGDSVQQGDTLLQISDEGRTASLAQAKAKSLQVQLRGMPAQLRSLALVSDVLSLLPTES